GSCLVQALHRPARGRVGVRRALIVLGWERLAGLGRLLHGGWLLGGPTGDVCGGSLFVLVGDLVGDLVDGCLDRMGLRAGILYGGLPSPRPWAVHAPTSRIATARHTTGRHGLATH